MMAAAALNDDGEFDSGQVTIPADSAWHRVITIDTLRRQQIIGEPAMRNIDVIPIDLAVGAGGAVNVRFTRSAKPEETHGLFNTDQSQSSRYLPLATTTGGTVNQPAANAIACYNISTEGSAEIGVEVQVVSAQTTVRAYGCFSFQPLL